MFPADLAREITRHLNSVRIPHRILLNKINSIRHPGPPSNIFDTAVTVYLRTDSVPKSLKGAKLTLAHDSKKNIPSIPVRSLTPKKPPN